MDFDLFAFEVEDFHAQGLLLDIDVGHRLIAVDDDREDVGIPACRMIDIFVQMSAEHQVDVGLVQNRNEEPVPFQAAVP